VLAHSNGRWQSFKANKNNEAFIDRICVIKVPYCLRVTEEQKIYEKLIRLRAFDRAVRTLDIGDPGALFGDVALAQSTTIPRYFPRCGSTTG